MSITFKSMLGVASVLILPLLCSGQAAILPIDTLMAFNGYVTRSFDKDQGGWMKLHLAMTRNNFALQKHSRKQDIKYIIEDVTYRGPAGTTIRFNASGTNLFDDGREGYSIQAIVTTTDPELYREWLTAMERKAVFIRQPMASLQEQKYTWDQAPITFTTVLFETSPGSYKIVIERLHAF